MWEELEPEKQAQFAGLFGQRQTGEQAFDETMRRWVFTDELGHWWQACQHKTGESHYSEESGASRIAAAYWRLKDANFMDITAKRIAAVRANTQNLVPQDQQSEKYFNENYEKLGPTPGFIWFQCDMVSKVVAENLYLRFAGHSNNRSVINGPTVMLCGPLSGRKSACWKRTTNRSRWMPCGW